jgi:hypothetical protein
MQINDKNYVVFEEFQSTYCGNTIMHGVIRIYYKNGTSEFLSLGDYFHDTESHKDNAGKRAAGEYSGKWQISFGDDWSYKKRKKQADAETEFIKIDLLESYD